MKVFETISIYIELLKLRLVSMTLLAVALGFVLGADESSSWWALFHALVGSLLSASGSMALNQYLERIPDGKMERTHNRPLPSGRVTPLATLIYGTLLIVVAVFYLLYFVNLPTAFLILMIAFLYVLVYTPLKQITWLNTPVGAIPGALPPVAGWTAATGNLDTNAWVLFLILFLWQHTHFYALAYLYRDDYRRGGFQMLPVVDEDGRRTAGQILLCSAALIPVTLLPYFSGLTGDLYPGGAIFLSVYFLGYSILFIRERTDRNARRLFRISLVYLPVLMLMIVIDVHGAF